MTKELLNIDEKLRTIFLRLERVLAVQFDAREMERVFSDSGHDQVSPKRYVFYQSSHISVSGSVDDYEPETIWLCLDGDQSLLAACAEILKDYEKAR